MKSRIPSVTILKVKLAFRLMRMIPLTSLSLPVQPVNLRAFYAGTGRSPISCRGKKKEFDLKSTDHFSLLSGLAYNHLHRDVFTALVLGATLYVPAPEILKSPDLLTQWLEQNEITVVHVTPALGRLLQTSKDKTFHPSVASFSGRCADNTGRGFDTQARAQCKNRQLLWRDGNSARRGRFRNCGRGH